MGSYKYPADMNTSEFEKYMGNDVEIVVEYGEFENKRRETLRGIICNLRFANDNINQPGGFKFIPTDGVRDFVITNLISIRILESNSEEFTNIIIQQ